jgi:hypothetical protein
VKMRIASLLVTLATVAGVYAAPSFAEPEAKTQLVTLDGKSVETLQLRHDFNSAWVVDNQNILFRDDTRDYYLVTLKQACQPLEVRNRQFAFHPGWSWRLKSTSGYEVRPDAGRPCEVATVAQITDDKANPMRDAALWRVW